MTPPVNPTLPHRPGGPSRVIQGSFPGGRPRLPQAAAPAPPQPVPVAARPAVQPASRPGPVQPAARPGLAAGRPQPILPNAARPAAVRPSVPMRPTAPQPISPVAPRPAAVQPSGGNAFAVPPGFQLRPSALGQRLPEAVQEKMEAVFGTSFADVRVHVGGEAASIGALAFTIGSDLYFAPGQYNPQTMQGQQLLGHELTHVVQQRSGRVRNPMGSGIAVVQDPALEAEAERMGTRAATTPGPVALQPKPAPGPSLHPGPVLRSSPPVQVSGPSPAGPGRYRISASAGGQVAGSVMVQAREGAAVELTDLSVDPAHRKQGLGEMLISSALRLGRDLGKSHVTLASQDNGSGRLTRWYQGLGFSRTGQHLGFPRLEAPISRVLTRVAQPRAAGPVRRPPSVPGAIAPGPARAAVQRMDSDPITSTVNTSPAKQQVVRAFRIEGETKSDKQEAGLLKHVPAEALKLALAELERDSIKLDEKQQGTLQEHWNDVVSLGEKKKTKEKEITTRISAADKEHIFRKLGMKASDILKKARQLQGQLEVALDDAAMFGSRLQIDGSHFISGTKQTGKVTGLIGSFNFSVGRPDHASYFASTFTGKAILIEFALDKAKWREWKDQLSGPQKANLGPRPPYMPMTLNDVEQPGVKYELQAGECQRFFQEVVVKDMPVTILPLPPSKGLGPNDVQEAVTRLGRVCDKLKDQLQTLTEEESKHEVEQYGVAESLRKNADFANATQYGQLRDLYKAINLTKNALHSARRKAAAKQDKKSLTS